MAEVNKYSFYTTKDEENDAIQLCDTLILLNSDIDWDQYDKDVRVVTETEAAGDKAAVTMRFVTYKLRRETEDEEATTIDDPNDMFDGVFEL